MTIRRKLLALAATVVGLLALSPVATAAAAPGADIPTGTVIVVADVNGASGVGLTGDLTVDLTCVDAAGDVDFTVIAPISGDSATATFPSVPIGLDCYARASAPPPAPAGYAWAGFDATAVVTLDTAGGTTSAVLPLALVPLEGDLAIVVGVVGGPPAGVTMDDVVSIDCGASYTQTRSVHLDNASSAVVTVSGIPSGLTCLVTAAGSPAAPESMVWSDLSLPATVTVVSGTTSVVEVLRTARSLGSVLTDATVTVTIFGGPTAGLTDTMFIALECDSGDYEAALSFAGAATASVVIPGVPAAAQCVARAQSLPSAPAGYAWFGASPVESVNATIDDGAQVALFGRLAPVPADPSTVVVPTTGSPATGSSSVSAGASVPAPSVEPGEAFTPIQAPTLATTSDPLPVTGGDHAVMTDDANAWALMLVGFALVMLGGFVAAFSIRAVVRSRRVRLAYA